MNSIKTILDQSDYEIYDDFYNIKIDGEFLDEVLHQAYPNRMFKGLIPTLLPELYNEEERTIVRQRILPDLKASSHCPILMCPDDCDFSCIIVIADIHRHSDSISWERLGIDASTSHESQHIGTEVEWLEGIGPYSFSIEEYKNMIADFEKLF